MLPREHFKLLNENSRVDVNEFNVNQIGTGTETGCGDSLFVGLAPQQTIFNRRQFNPSESRSFFAQPCSNFRNHLIFIRSKLGEMYYLPNKPQWVSIYQLERDLLFQGKTMSGIGRNLLFQVINPSSTARLELAVSATLKGDGKNELPPAAAIGNERLLFPIVGRETAGVFTSVDSADHRRAFLPRN